VRGSIETLSITLGQTFMRKFYTSFYIDAKKIFVGHYQDEQEPNRANNQNLDKKFSTGSGGPIGF